MGFNSAFKGLMHWIPLRTPASFTWRHLSICLPTLCIQHVPVNPCVCPSRVTKLYLRLWDFGIESSVFRADHDSRDMHLSAATSERLLTTHLSKSTTFHKVHRRVKLLCLKFIWRYLKKMRYFTEDNTAYKLRKPRFRNFVIWNYTQTFTSSSLHNIY